MRIIYLRLLATVALLLGAGVGALASAADNTLEGFQVIDTLNYIDAWSENSVGSESGTRISLGMDLYPLSTDPDEQTRLLKETTVQVWDGETKIADTPYMASLQWPYLFYHNIPYTSDYNGKQWTLSITNPEINDGEPQYVTTAPLTETQPPPFVTDLAIQTDDENITLSWALPADNNADQITIPIFDRADRVPGTGSDPSVASARLIDLLVLGSTATSITVQRSEIPDDAEYSVAVQLDRLDGSDDDNVLARSRSLIDLMLPPSGVDGPVFLPHVGIDPDPDDDRGPSFSFDIHVKGGPLISVDPPLPVAGYEYQTGTGDPLFQSVLLPKLGKQDRYKLCLWQDGGYNDCHWIDAEQEHTFAGDGIDRFEVLGINPGLGLSPSDTTAFVTGLTFADDGMFTGTMTPLLGDSDSPIRNVPGPGVIGLFALSLLLTLIGGVSRRNMR